MKKLLFSLLVCFGFLYTNTTQANTLYSYPSGKVQSIKQDEQSIYIINIWATWCAPCRKEMPELNRWYKKQLTDKKTKFPIKLIGIAIDNPKNIDEFIQKNPVSYPLWYFEGDSTEWMQSLGNKIGAIPYTVILAPHCQFKKPILGEFTQTQLSQFIKQAVYACSKN